MQSFFRRLALAVLAFAVAVPGSIMTAPAAEAHSGSSYVSVYNPVVDGDSVHNDVTAYWATTAGTQPSVHHIVYSNWGYMNDVSVDIYGVPGRRVVSPFGTKTSDGHATKVTVISVKAGCASGKIADGGYRVTVEVKDTVTGVVLGRADLMHVDSPQVAAGKVLGPWDTIGYTDRFRYSSCYQVSSNSGVHIHLEWINKHNYACYITRASGGALTELTKIGKVGVHKSGQRAKC